MTGQGKKEGRNDREGFFLLERVVRHGSKLKDSGYRRRQLGGTKRILSEKTGF